MADDDRELQRRLDAMYGSARPRAGFDDELWRRIQARRPWYRKLGDAFQPGLRLAPALAALLVVAVGFGWLLSHVHVGAGGSSTASLSTGAAGVSGGPGFGVLPAPPGTARAVTAPNAAGVKGTAAPGIDSSQAAPARYLFIGKLPELPGQLAVYRYDEPTPAARSAAAAQLQKQSGLRVDVQPSRPAAGTEPQFVIRGVEAQLSLPTLEGTAEAFVSGHMLIPGYSFRVTVPTARQAVIYTRQFPVAGASVPEVRPAGEAAGLEVRVEGNLVVGASGPLELALATADYPLRTAAEVLAAAGAQPGATASAGPVLDGARLVYVVVASGGHGYYEPAILFTGPAGTVLVPLVSSAWLKPST